MKECESEVYDKIWFNEGYQRPEHFRRFDAVYILIASFVKRNDLVLELGCGTGYFAKRFLVGRCKDFLSIDFSKMAIDVARRGYSELREKFQIFDMRMLHELDYLYTVVVATEVLEHTDRDIEVLESIKPGTLVLFSVPKEEKQKKELSRHRRMYTYKTFEERYGKVLIIDRIFSIGVGKGIKMSKGKMRLDDRHSYVVVGRRRVG